MSKNPFQPGAGGYPPVLAGREDEQAQLVSLVESLADWQLGQPLQAIHVVQAPRGMGKTVLLQALERRASDDTALAKVTILRTPASNLPTLADVARRIEPEPSWLRKLLGWVAGLRVLVVLFQRPLRDGGGETVDVKMAFDRRRRLPFLLLVDEAHTLPPEVCHVLLNEFQDRSTRQPCALVLVGTPALHPYLLSAEVNASFVERAPLIVPGLLSSADAVKALRVPDWEGWEVDEKVLDVAVEDSLGYPYFLQLWGSALWNAGQDRLAVDPSAQLVATREVDAARTALYVNRFDEFEDFATREGLDRRAVLDAVQAVARQVETPGSAITTGKLNDLLEQAGLDPRASALVRRCTMENGLLVRTGDDWGPAIPSLAAYMSEHPR